MAKIKTHPRISNYSHDHKPKKVSQKSFKDVYWPYIPVVLVVGLMLYAGGRHGNYHTAFNRPPGSVLSYATSMQSSKLIDSTNQQRQAANLAPLNLSSKLSQAAQAKATDMAARDYWSHDTPDGNPPWTFVSQQNYAYQKLGENLAAGFDTEQAAIGGWMASPAHRDNMLDPQYTEVGFGIAQDPDYKAAGGGPMTIVVAFYGQPGVASAPALVKADSTTNPVSFAQLAAARLPIEGLATNIAMLVLAGALGIWLGRHFVGLRRALAAGERYVMEHPFIDVGLVIIAAMAYLLTRTAGFIN